MKREITNLDLILITTAFYMILITAIIRMCGG